MALVKEICSCEVCGNTNLRKVLDLGNQPLCDDLRTKNDHRHTQRYPIEVMFCDNCKTCHQKHQVQKEVLFGENYHYRARMTSDVLTGMRQLVESVRRQSGNLRGRRVLDVGCNDGSLLVEFAAYGARTYGIDPTGAADEAKERGLDAVWKDYMTPLVAKEFVHKYGHPDIITFTNVFAHIDNLPTLLESLKILKATYTTIVIENHYLGAVLDRHQFDTFYHEHPRTYSFTSFETIAKSLDMSITFVEYPERYGGNIRVFLEHAEPNEVVPGPFEADFGVRLDELALGVERWRSKKLCKFYRLRQLYGPLPAVAFPGRAAIAFSLLGLAYRGFVDRVYEKPGSKKIGYCVPGTKVPIVSETTAGDISKIPVLVNLAWHIPLEIQMHWGAMGFTGKMVQIIDAEDFK